MYLKIIAITLLLNIANSKESCTNINVLVTQNVENEGFHRDIKWLIEIGNDSLKTLQTSSCSLALKQHVPPGLFVNPDQIADLVQVGKIHAVVVGHVDVELPMHLSEPHTAYVFTNNSLDKKISLQLPIHLRYQRSQITGGYGKVELPPFSLLFKCRNNLYLCGNRLKVAAPCTYANRHSCQWTNVSYQDTTNDIRMLVPIGDLDHYPLVSIVTLLVACAGCIYILSILSTTVL